MTELWETWGGIAYLVAALWAFFEGESFVIVAAAIGRTTGLVDPGLLLVSVWLGSFAGDQTWFYLARRFGPAALKRFPRAGEQVARASDMLERHGALFVLSFRFIYGIRNVSSAACGLAGMGRRRFAILNFLAAGLWATAFVAGGWFVGTALEEDYGVMALAVGLLAIVLTVVYRGTRPRAVPVPSVAVVRRKPPGAD